MDWRPRGTGWFTCVQSDSGIQLPYDPETRMGKECVRVRERERAQCLLTFRIDAMWSMLEERRAPKRISHSTETDIRKHIGRVRDLGRLATSRS